MEDRGFDTRPDRHPAATVALVAVVVVATAAFAEGFRRSAEWVIEWYSGAAGSTGAAGKLAPWIVGALVTSVVLVAAAIERHATRIRPGGSGLAAIAASARGEGRRISSTATAYRAGAIWTVAGGLVSLGRESAIIETGGALGAVTGRRSGGKGDAMAVAGIAAGFAAAYHAPLAATVYLEEHLGIRRSRRAVRFAVAGALGGHLTAMWLLGGHAIFPGIEGSRWELLAAGLVVVLPAVAASRVFRRLRIAASADGWRARLTTRRRHLAVAAAALVAGATVALIPDAAGNGMDALRSVPAAATYSLAAAMLIGKIIGTTAALAAGTPGGVISPSMAIAGGAALLVALAAQEAGVPIDHPWDVVVAAMVVGVVVGLRSPLMAPLLVAELLGDYTLVPALVVIALAAYGADRVIDVVVTGPPEKVRDEDA